MQLERTCNGLNMACKPIVETNALSTSRTHKCFQRGVQADCQPAPPSYLEREEAQPGVFSRPMPRVVVRRLN